MARIVSLPCLEWFKEQDQAYCDSVTPLRVRARVPIEAGVAVPWCKCLGDAGVPVSIEIFGKPNSGAESFRFFGFTVENVVAKAKESLAKTKT